MKKLTIALILAGMTGTASAHSVYYSDLIPFVMGGIAGYAIKAAQQQPAAVIQSTNQINKSIYVYPEGSPTPIGMKCNLQSVYVNGQVITNNYCY